MRLWEILDMDKMQTSTLPFQRMQAIASIGTRSHSSASHGKAANGCSFHFPPAPLILNQGGGDLRQEGLGVVGREQHLAQFP